jgi:hypothetical protein
MKSSLFLLSNEMLPSFLKEPALDWLSLKAASSSYPMKCCLPFEKSQLRIRSITKPPPFSIPITN